jgi:hypothetical protein
MLEHIHVVITQMKNVEMIKEIEEIDIINAIWSLHHENFYIHFYGACWSIVNINLKRILNFVQKSCKLGDNTNSSFLDLIPK